MNEDPTIIRMTVAHYRALLKLDMHDDRRVAIKRLLTRALAELVPKAS